MVRFTAYVLTVTLSVGCGMSDACEESMCGDTDVTAETDDSGTKNACEELKDAICACDDDFNQLMCADSEASGQDPADADDEEIEACEALMPYECGGSFDTGM